MCFLRGGTEVFLPARFWSQSWQATVAGPGCERQEVIEHTPGLQGPGASLKPRSCPKSRGPADETGQMQPVRGRRGGGGLRAPAKVTLCKSTCTSVRPSVLQSACDVFESEIRTRIPRLERLPATVVTGDNCLGGVDLTGSFPLWQFPVPKDPGVWGGKILAHCLRACTVGLDNRQQRGEKLQERAGH